MTARLLIAVLAEVPACTVIVLIAVARMLRTHRTALAAVIARRAADLATHIDGAEGAVRAHAGRHLDTVAGNLEGLAEAVRALLASRQRPGGGKAAPADAVPPAGESAESRM